MALHPVLARRPRGRSVSRIGKRAEDVVVASLALLFLSPVLLTLAAAIRLETPGPVIYRQQRQGQHGRVFHIWKFRTMRADRCDDGASAPVVQAERDDPRVTRVGRILRRTSLDELPQLVNVLKGDMSLVGPRPHAVAHNREYETLIPGYAGRHAVRPGITGLAQIEGLRGPTPTLELMRRRVERDLLYIQEQSLRLDLIILAKTLFLAFGDEQAI